MDAFKLNQLRKNALESITNRELEYTLNIAQMLLLGKYGVIVYNIKDALIEYYGGQAYELLGYSESEVQMPLLRSLVHPDDENHFKQNERGLKVFFGGLNSDQILNFKAGHDFRIRRKDGEYIHIYKQIIPMAYITDFGLSKALLVFTEIGHLKPSRKFDVKYTGLNGQPVPVNASQKTTKKNSNNTPFSVREIEVLKLVALNKSTGDISGHLNISPHTVRIHRKNLLKKAGARSSLELVMMANEKGWI